MGLRESVCLWLESERKSKSVCVCVERECVCGAWFGSRKHRAVPGHVEQCYQEPARGVRIRERVCVSLEFVCVCVCFAREIESVCVCV